MDSTKGIIILDMARSRATARLYLHPTWQTALECSTRAPRPESASSSSPSQYLRPTPKEDCFQEPRSRTTARLYLHPTQQTPWGCSTRAITHLSMSPSTARTWRRSLVPPSHSMEPRLRATARLYLHPLMQTPWGCSTRSITASSWWTSARPASRVVTNSLEPLSRTTAR